MAAIVDAARRDDVNILCIQESSRIMPDALKGLHSTCRALGFRLDVGPQDEHGGVAVLSDHPVARVALPDFLEFGHRVMAVQVSRTGIRPLMLVNVYVHANDKQLGTHLLQSVFQWLRMMAVGAVFPMNTAYVPENGTHRNADGELYQGPPVADHDLVAYDLPQGPPTTRWRWQPRVGLDLGRSDTWHAVWPKFQLNFESALVEGDTESAWHALSASAEEALRADGARTAPPRGLPGRPVREQPVRLKLPSFQTLLERQLRRLARRVYEYTRFPTAVLATKLESTRASWPHVAGDACEGKTWSEIAAKLTDLANEEAARAKAARIAKWKEEIQEDIPRMARWI
eukprot:s349_g12.t2